MGMTFPSIEVIKSFYRDYGFRAGFATKTRSSKKAHNGECKYLILACSREGDHQSSGVDDFKRQPSTKINCTAKITVALRPDALWHITIVCLDHVHQLSSHKSRLFHANRVLNMNVQRAIHMNDSAGIRVNKTHCSLVQDAGGYKNVSFVERVIRNFIAKERRLLGKDGDGKALVDYFSRMQQQNNNFFYEMELDNEFHIKIVF